MISKARPYLAVLAMLLSCSGCATYQPPRTDDICSIFRGDTDWYASARDANKRWGTPVWVMMAIIDQESRFVSDAKPARDWFLFIPLPRQSSAYGYAQAQDQTWDKYMKETGNSGHDRDDFADAINFVGWYTNTTQRTLGISKWDAYYQYLAYHEGYDAYKSGSWKSKGWLQQAAAKVKNKAAAYNAQLKKCKPELDDKVDSWF
ncbi:MAG: transglycosylase SLT domain-containing protein [Gallionella sp.]